MLRNFLLNLSNIIVAIVVRMLMKFQNVLYQHILQYIRIRWSEKFLSFHKMIIDEQQFLFYIILSN